MKKFWHLLAGLFLILTSATFTSCVDGDFEEPPITIPTVEFEANTTIADLKASYTSLRNGGHRTFARQNFAVQRVQTWPTRFCEMQGHVHRRLQPAHSAGIYL